MIPNVTNIKPMPEPDIEVEHSAHLRMATLFEDFAAGETIYVKGIGWHHWDGTRWAIDESSMTERKLHKLFKREWIKAFDIGDEKKRKEAIQAISRCETAGGIRGVLEVAQTLAGFSTLAEELDSDPYLVNTPSGTMDLHNPDAGARPHDPADKITKITVGAYDPTAKSKTWDAFLAQVLPDPEVRAYLRRVAGLALLGKVIEHVLVFLVGVGSNGKGVTYNALDFAFGDYSGIPDAGLFMEARASNHNAASPGEMKLRGMRLAVISESGRDKAIDEARMKRLTGGDPITARDLFKPPVTFPASHTPILITNHLPTVSGDDPAVWRRIFVVRFGVIIPDEKQNGHLGEELEAEADAVLTWAVEGWRDYVACGSRLAPPKAVLNETRKYRDDSDDVGRFLSDENWIVLGADKKDTTGRLHAAYRIWAETEGGDDLTAKQLGKILDAKGFPVSCRDKSGRYREGLQRESCVAGNATDQAWSKRGQCEYCEAPLNKSEMELGTCTACMLSNRRTRTGKAR